MQNQLTFSLFILFGLTAVFLPQSTAQTTDQKSGELLAALEKANGGWAALAKLKDVEYRYEYHDKGKNATDLSTERYIFAGEVSWAEYDQHKVNVLPDQEGKVRQRLMAGKAEITLDGKPITNPQAVGGTAFLRSANFYWFTMMYKLSDPGTIHKYLGTEEVNGMTYEKVSLTYENTGKEANDEYILYFNPETHLVDQFYFSLPAMGVNKPVMRMELEYEKIQGVYVNTVRRGIYPGPTGEYQLGGVYKYTQVKFNNGFDNKDLSL